MAADVKHTHRPPQPRAAGGLQICESPDMRDPYLCLRFGCGSELRRKLEHRRFLIFEWRPKPSPLAIRPCRRRSCPAHMDAAAIKLDHIEEAVIAEVLML